MGPFLAPFDGGENAQDTACCGAFLVPPMLSYHDEASSSCLLPVFVPRCSRCYRVGCMCLWRHQRRCLCCRAGLAHGTRVWMQLAKAVHAAEMQESPNTQETRDGFLTKLWSKYPVNFRVQQNATQSRSPHSHQTGKGPIWPNPNSVRSLLTTSVAIVLVSVSRRITLPSSVAFIGLT
jgi:hypothetical protein